MVAGRDVLREVVDRPESWIGTAGLNRACSGGRVVGRIRPVQKRPLVAHVVNLNDRAREKLMLDAEVPMLVVTHSQPGVGRPQARRGRRRQCASEEEIGHRAYRWCLIVKRGLVELEGNHVVIDAAVGILRFVEYAVTAA